MATAESLELLYQLSDDELLDEIYRRGLEAPEAARDLEDVRDALMRNKPDEALCILDTILFPKWSSSRVCEEQYRVAMKDKTAA